MEVAIAQARDLIQQHDEIEKQGGKPATPDRLAPARDVRFHERAARPVRHQPPAAGHPPQEAGGDYDHHDHDYPPANAK